MVVARTCPTLCNPWTVTHQAPPSMEFFRQEDWSGLPFPSPGDRPDPGIEPRSPALGADALTSEPPGKALEAKASANQTHKHIGKNFEASFAELDPVVKKTFLKLHAVFFFLHSFLLILSAVLYF